MGSELLRFSLGRNTGGSHTPNIAKASLPCNTKPIKGHHTEQEPHDTLSLQESVFCPECSFSQLDFFGRQGWRSPFTMLDAAVNLWRRESISITSEALTNAGCFQSWLYDDNFSLMPSEEQLEQYIARLRTTDGNSTVDWRSLKRETMSFRTATYEHLQDCLAYMASRYVSVKDKLIRCGSPTKVETGGSDLRRICFAGVSEMVTHYTQKLQGSLSLSPADISDIRESFITAFQYQIQRYEKLLQQIHQSVAREYPEDRWLKNHDGFIAAQLREAAGAEDVPAHCRYTVRDLTIIGQVAQFYQKEMDGVGNGNRHEANLALNLAMVDMKAELLIRRGLVSSGMATLLRDIRTYSHNGVLDGADQYLSTASDNPQPAGRQAVKPPMNRAMFRSIHDAVLQAFQNNGGDAPQAIRAGVVHGQRITAQESEHNPGVFRWGKPMADFWHNFYITPEHGELSPLEQKVQQMLANIGQSRTYNSTYQNYVNDWRGFLTFIDCRTETATYK